VAVRFVSNIESGDRVYIGFSLCDSKDRYDKVIGKQFARGKALTSYEVPLRIPASILKEYITFHERCEKYFKGCVFPTKVQIYNGKGYIDAEVESTPVSIGVSWEIDPVPTPVEEVEAPECSIIDPPTKIDCACCGDTDCLVHPGREPYTSEA
jgi:hypothetical protein